ncbi:MAG: type II toxin-antitoxin system VapC family toxin, partial [Gammaproteobacteria bacterium]
PALTCEAVITEAWHVLRHYPMGQRSILKLLGQGSIEIRFTLMAEIAAIIKLTARYANVPMSVADACLVRMAEIYSGSAVATLDSDFAIYRKQGRQVIPLITPLKRRG